MSKKIPNLKEMREDLMLSQLELAEKARVSKSTIARLERGESAHDHAVKQIGKQLHMFEGVYIPPSNSHLYQLSLKIQKILLDDVKIGTFPKDNLRYSFRLFSCFANEVMEENFLEDTRELFNKGEPFEKLHVKEAPLYIYFSFPRSHYFVAELVHKAIGVTDEQYDTWVQERY